MSLLSRTVEAPEDVEAHLEVLKRAELVHETQFFPEPEYAFKHAIFQEVVYQSLLAPRRKQLHRLIGEALEEMTTPTLSEHGSALAYHFSRGDVAGKAVKYLIEAGDRAAAAFSNREALDLYRQALELHHGGERAIEAALLHKLGTASIFLGDAAASLRYVEAALEVYQALGDKRNALRMHLDISRLSTDGYGDAAEEDRARRHLEAVAASVETDDDSLEKGLIYQRAAHLYLHRGQPSTSLGWAHRAVDLFARLQIPMGTSLGTILSYMGHVDEGVAYNEKNWDAVVTAANPLVIAGLGHELTLTLALALDVPRARAWGEKGWPLAMKRARCSRAFSDVPWRWSTPVRDGAGDRAAASRSARSMRCRPRSPASARKPRAWVFTADAASATGPAPTSKPRRRRTVAGMSRPTPPVSSSSRTCTASRRT